MLRLRAVFLQSWFSTNLHVPKYLKDPAYYYKLSTELPSLHHSLKIITQLSEVKFSHQEFENIWSTFSYFIAMILGNENEQDKYELKLDFLEALLELWNKYNTKQQFTSKRMTTAINQFCEPLLLECLNKPLSSFMRLIFLIAKYNPAKAKAHFLKKQKHISMLLNQLNSNQLIKLLDFMRCFKIDHSLFREVAISNLYPELNKLSLSQLNEILWCLSSSYRYINKDFLIGLIKNYLQIFTGSLEKEPIQLASLIYSLNSFSIIEKSMNNNSIFLPEMDSLYEILLQYVFQHLKEMRSNLLAITANVLRRAKYYHKQLIRQICREALKRNILEFFPEEKTRPNLHNYISLEQFSCIFHMVASLNCHDNEQFQKYALEVLKLLQHHKQSKMEVELLDRIIWSSCVLFNKAEMMEIYPLVSLYFERAIHLSPRLSVRNCYYCYLYLKVFFPIIKLPEAIRERLKGEPMVSQVSFTQKQVHQTMISLGVPCLIEFNIDNLMCDIMIPQWKSLTNIVIDIHGFHHFLRNVKHTNGAHHLKKKLLNNSFYKYYYISLDEWAIHSNKKQFCFDFLETLNSHEKNITPKNLS